MSLYIYFLKGCGLKGLISVYESDEDTNNDSDIKISVDGENNINMKKVKEKKPVCRRWYKRWFIRVPINVAYIIFLLSNILWPCVYVVVHTHRERNVRFVYSNIFMKVVYVYAM